MLQQNQATILGNSKEACFLIMVTGGSECRRRYQKKDLQDSLSVGLVFARAQTFPFAFPPQPAIIL